MATDNRVLCGVLRGVQAPIFSLERSSASIGRTQS